MNSKKDPSIIFQVGPGIVFVVPITQIGYLSDNIYNIKLNTCQTYKVLNKYSNRKYGIEIDNLIECLQEKQKIIDSLNMLKPIIFDLYKFIQ